MLYLLINYKKLVGNTKELILPDQSQCEYANRREVEPDLSHDEFTYSIRLAYRHYISQVAKCTEKS